MVQYYKQKKFSEDLKNKKRKRKIVILLIFLSFSFAVVLFLIFSPIFRVDLVEVTSEKMAFDGDLKDFVENELHKKTYYILPNDNYFVSFFVELGDKIKSNFTSLKEVNIDKDFPNTIYILITERQSSGIWCPSSMVNNKNDKCYYVDQDGVIFTDAPTLSGALILVLRDFSGIVPSLGDKVVDKDLIDRLVLFKDLAYNNMDIRVIEFRLFPEGSSKIEAVSAEGWKIIFDPSETEISKTLVKLGAILDKEIKDRRNDLEYVDLRIGNRVYYKYKNSL